MAERILPLLALGLIAACKPAASEDHQPAGTGVPLACDAGAVQGHIGTAFDAALGTALTAQSGARTLRSFKSGDAVTMDFRGDRLNVEIGDDGRIVRINCG